MSLPKKKSRPICVDEIDFRYIITTSRADDSQNFKLNTTIQIADGDGSLLLIKGLVTPDFWLDFSNSSLRIDHYQAILPNHIEKFIKKAIKEGWNPNKKSQPFSLELDNKSVFN